jgi:ATP-dependent Clp protease adaptor protein ClpS
MGAKRVVIVNDDITPMDFVVFVLGRVFNLSPEKSHEVTWETHNAGVGIVGTFPADEAEEYVETANAFSRRAGFPLVCELVVE